MSDTYFDFSIALDLIFSLQKTNYGLVSLSLEWLPGLVIFFHHISTNRESQSTLKTILIALLSMISYPILLTFTILYVLLKRPKNSRPTKQFQNALKFLTILQVISGCFEAPLQMTYNLWLIFNGVLPSNFGIKCVYVNDLNGNRLCIPVSVSLSIVFSLFATMMTVFNLNIPKSSTNGKILTYLEYGPFLILATCFKITSLVVMITMTTWSFIPIIVLISSNIILHELLLEEEHGVPKWILTTTSLFIPFLPTSEITRKSKMFFAAQILLSVIINGITILVIYLLKVTSQLNVELILNDVTYQILVWSTLSMGLVSVIVIIPKFITCSYIEKVGKIWNIVSTIIALVLLLSFVQSLILTSNKSGIM